MSRLPKKQREIWWIKQLLFAAVIGSIFVQCASIAKPEGGPRDSLPPLIISTSPPQRSTNFHGKRVVLNFNEYVVLKDQQKQFMVSPPGEKKPALSIKGRSIEALFDNDLDTNTTYRLDFGTSIVDNNESNPLGGYAFVFSTGPHIDSLMMGGLVIDAQKRDSLADAIIFFYEARDLPDTPYDSTLFTGRPKAMFRSDSAGFFLADILRDTDYRVYAIIDKNGNQKYEAGTDLVAILDTVYNPTRMPPFDIWIEAGQGRRGPRRKINPPQLTFEAFMEEPVKRQTVIGSSRPERQKLEIVFNARHPEILSFETNLDSTWLIQERGVLGDTVRYWIAPPTLQDVEALRDTIRAKITFMTQDSLWQSEVRTDNLVFTHRIIDPYGRTNRRSSDYYDSIQQVKKEAKQLKRAQKLQKKWLKRARKISRRRGDGKLPDSVLLKDSTLFQQVQIDTTQREKKTDTPEELINPFKYTVAAANPLNPENHIRLTFDYPLRMIDSTRISLVKLTEPTIQSAASRRDMRNVFNQSEDQKIEKTETPVPFRLETDTTGKVLKWTRIVAEWETDAEYKLLIPDSVFVNIAFEKNDTLQSTFKVANPDKFGMLSLELKAGGDSTASPYLYILELQNATGKTVQLIQHAQAGHTYPVRYLPAGTYHLRVTEDRNGNGEWDTGSLVDRKPPERVRIWNGTAGVGRNIVVNEGWQSTEIIDLEELFSKP